jgi:hypothetical protein
MESVMQSDRDGINWAAVLVSFIAAAFVGPAVGAGLALIATVFLSIALGAGAVADALGTRLAVAGSTVAFVAAWWGFYRLARRVFE